MLRAQQPWPAGPAAQRGLSLVELMVGLAVGLLVVAGAAMVSAAQLSDTRRLLLETQLQQDLRATGDLITRELRRSGSSAYGNQSLANVWSTSSPAYAVNTADITITGGTEISYKYRRAAGASLNAFGFRLNNGVIEYNLDGTSWQALTDAKAMQVTNFSISRTDGPAVQLPCPKECSGGGTACFPTWQVRELAVAIDGSAVADPSVQRSIRAAVRVRNDVLAASGLTQVCPA
jgi:type IV pilus assembly protein PilW